MNNKNDYFMLCVDVYKKINDLKKPNSNMLLCAAELYSNGNLHALPPHIMMMPRQDLIPLLINDIFKKLKKNHIRFKNYNSLHNFIKNNIKYSYLTC